MSQDDHEPVFNPGKAEWVQSESAQDLDPDQKALLLALIQLETETGRDLSPEERSALETLASQLQGFHSEEIKSAIQRMVNQPTDPKRSTSWSELQGHLRNRK